jgi:heat shock protein HtpX
MNIYEQIDKNKRNTWFLITGFIVFLLAIGAGFDYYYGATYKDSVPLPFFSLVALAIAILMSLGSFFYGDKLVLSSTHARALNLNNEKERQFLNVIEEMSIASGLPKPLAYVIDDSDPNAFATGRNPEHSSIVATKGLLDVLNRDELQGVVAHEMSHIKNYDIRLMLVVAVLVGTIALLSDWARRSLFFSRNSRDRRNDGSLGVVILVIWLVSIILAPILAQIMAMFVSRRREYLADATGAELSRNPLALASALEKIDSRVEPTRSINRGTAHLCIADPKGSSINLKEGFVADLFATHPPIKKRIEALKQMAYIKSTEGR